MRAPRLTVMCLLCAAMFVPASAFAQDGPSRDSESRTTAPPSTPRAERDSLWRGVLLGGAIGLGAGATVALLADCSSGRANHRCGSDRASVIALSTALGAGLGLGMDAVIGPEFTGAPLPGPPASERRVGLPPPSSRGAGVRFRLAW